MSMPIVSELRVMHSAAGYYIGTECYDCAFWQPYERLSGYWAEEERAVSALSVYIAMEMNIEELEVMPTIGYHKLLGSLDHDELIADVLDEFSNHGPEIYVI